jgi:virginiamycin B lyase
MKRLTLLAVAIGLTAPAPVVAQATQNVDLREWPIERGGRSRDPYVAPDGKVWFVGQAGNYVANLDPASGAVKYYEIEPRTNPHTLIVADDGMVWYAGNQNGRIGRLDPATGELKIFMTGDARDPHTMHFDGRGNIWFSSQGSSRIGRLDMASGEVELVNPLDRNANPYGLDLAPDGKLYVSLFSTNMIAAVDPATLQVRTFPTADGGRIRRNAVTPDGMVWYVDYQRGYVGRLDPRTGETKEWLAPGGAQSRPYAITADDQGRLWVSETGSIKQLVGFDPKTERFFAVVPVSNTIRNMMFDPRSGTMWFGTDSNNIGRVVTRRIVS